MQGIILVLKEMEQFKKVEVLEGVKVVVNQSIGAKYIMIDSVTLKQLAEQQRRDYYKQYRELNNEKLKEYRKQWRLNNKDKIKKYNDDYWKKKALAAIEEAKQRGEV